ncbi:hypothetical protein QQM79_04100 [Marinobacteraceae bacterium S3BR75-40.1]
MKTVAMTDSQQRLVRLYDLKQQQLQQQEHQCNSLMYRVLMAEAEAIVSAIKHQHSS